MKTEHFQVRVGWPQLPKVLQELASAVLSDDWARYATGDEKLFYYIVGMKAWTADQQNEQHFDLLSVPTRQHISPLRESEVHAQVAATKPSDYYVNHARARLEETGADPEAIDVFMQGVRGVEVNWASLAGKFNTLGTERLAAFADLLQALIIEKGIAPEDPSSEAEKRRELDVAVQKVYLRELSHLYDSVVRRAASLETLTFSDPQLNEASRCFLYGFFRAAVVLSASAVENCLRVATGTDGLANVEAKKGIYGPLVEEATNRGLLGPRVRMGQEPACALYSRQIFTFRNNVVHGDHEPSSAQAAELLTKAREVVEFIHGKRI
jgi:hypothetical protein